MGGSAAKTAASQQAKTQQQALQEELAIQQVIQQQLAPWLTTGRGALDSLSALIHAGGDPTTSVLGTSPLTTFGTAPNIFTPGITQAIQGSPGYQFQLQQGTQAIDQSGAGRTGALSGNTLKALNQYGQGVAGTNFMDYLRNLQSSWGQNVGAQSGYQQQLYNMLSGLSGAGQNAAVQQGGFATAGAGPNLLAGLGTTQAAGTLGGASALSGGLSGLFSALTTNNPNTGQSPLAWLLSGLGGRQSTGGGDFPGEI